ncbi:MAG TPA: hypothetical protein VMZ28_19885 [Kofleriaceae bacterium]|nr:hypothetical protein [Kofleriaceae bacterium]
MRLLLPLLLSLVFIGGGCGSNAAKTVCTVDALIAAQVSGRQYVDCTAVAADADAGVGAEAMARAQGCVLEAVRQNQAFVFAYDVPHAINHLRVGYAGVPGGSAATVREYVYSGDVAGKPGDAHPTVSTKTCSALGPDAALVATPGCTPSVGRPCLTCVKASVGAITCGG